ncbi:MFS transporter [Elongatibacter sediminis]|uniref:MFS transporter n=1 Tax=Elongatibacter sediminis TaxID=3119006 RepID=A0AAW9RHN5_9GAMM
MIDIETRPNASDSPDTVSAVASLIAVGVLGVASFLVLPSIILAVQKTFSFSEAQLGQVATAQLIGLALGSVAVVWLTKRLHWRAVARWGLLVLLGADVVSTLVSGFPEFLGARFASGFAGGICVSLASYGLGQTARKDRNFSLFLGSQVAFAIAANSGFPAIVERLGVLGVFGALVVLETVVLLALTSRVPARRWIAQAEGAGNTRWNWLASSFVLLGIVLFMTAIGAFWTYVAPISMEAGYSAQQTGTAISIGLMSALAGSWAASFLQDRMGRLLPIAAATVLQTAALVILFVNAGYVGFVAGAVLFCFGWYFCLPYQFALLASVDQDGKPMMLLNAFAGLGSAIGPAIAAVLVQTGFTGVYVLCFTCLLLSHFSHGSVIIMQWKRA